MRRASRGSHGDGSYHAASTGRRRQWAQDACRLQGEPCATRQQRRGRPLAAQSSRHRALDRHAPLGLWPMMRSRRCSSSAAAACSLLAHAVRRGRVQAHRTRQGRGVGERTCHAERRPSSWPASGQRMNAGVPPCHHARDRRAATASRCKAGAAGSGRCADLAPGCCAHAATSHEHVGMPSDRGRPSCRDTGTGRLTCRLQRRSRRPLGDEFRRRQTFYRRQSWVWEARRRSGESGTA